MFEGQFLCAAGGGWLSTVGPLIRAPTVDPQPEPGGSQARGNHWTRCAPGPPAAGKGRPRSGAALHQHLSPVLRRGGLQLYPLTGAPSPCWLQGGFIVSEADFCMGGPLLTVGAPWIAPAGHGSHGPTMYYTPGRARPPAGGPVQEKPGKTTIPPAGDDSRRNWTLIGLYIWRGAGGPPSRVYRIRFCGLPSRALSSPAL